MMFMVSCLCKGGFTGSSDANLDAELYSTESHRWQLVKWTLPAALMDFCTHTQSSYHIIGHLSVGPAGGGGSDLM
jgi:hypothetical protein